MSLNYGEIARLLSAVEKMATAVTQMAADVSEIRKQMTPTRPPVTPNQYFEVARPCGCACHYMPGVSHITACCAAPPYRDAQSASTNQATGAAVNVPHEPVSESVEDMPPLVAAIMLLSVEERTKVFQDVLDFQLPVWTHAQVLDRLAFAEGQGQTEMLLQHPQVARAMKQVAQRMEPETYPQTRHIERHAEKQGVSYGDAWRYFEKQGYDMSGVDDKYSRSDES